MADDRKFLLAVSAHPPPRQTRSATANLLFAKVPSVKSPFIVALTFLVLCGCGFIVITVPALAQKVLREQDIGELRLGQRIKVDDGTCPAGQIKEISGTRMTPAGIIRSQKCIPRLGPKQK
jgi:hypothetical protein